MEPVLLRSHHSIALVRQSASLTNCSLTTAIRSKRCVPTRAFGTTVQRTSVSSAVSTTTTSTQTYSPYQYHRNRFSSRSNVSYYSYQQRRPQQQYRTFFSLPSSSSSTPQSFSATRRLSYPPATLFNIISDIDSYQQFIPYCTNSQVTSRTAPIDSPSSSSSSSLSLPTSAELRVGWGGFDETFKSRLMCNQEKGLVVADADASGSQIFKVLRARWRIDEAGGVGTTHTATPRGNDSSSSLGLSKYERRMSSAGGGAKKEASVDVGGGREVVNGGGKGQGGGESQVHLEIEYQFSNPLYAMASEAVMPKVAGKIIEAFEKRAYEISRKSKVS